MSEKQKFTQDELAKIVELPSVLFNSGAGKKSRARRKTRILNNAD